MATNDDLRGADQGNSAADAVGGVGGAIPFLNIIAPGLQQQIAAGADRQRRQKAIEELQGSSAPRFSSNELQAAGYSGDFNPEKYSDPVAAQYQTVTEDPRTRSLQMQALARMQQFGDQAADSTEALGRYNAMSDANAMAAQREAGVRNQMQMRGQGGSGAEFAMQQIAAQEGANRAQAGTMNAAQQAALQRLQGINSAFGAASGMRGQDYNTQKGNTDVINAFNMRNTDALNAARQANTGLSNAAGLRNLDARQQNLNGVAGANNANIARTDNNAMQFANWDLNKRGQVAGQITGSADASQRNNKAVADGGKQGYENLKSMFNMGAAGGM